VLSNFFFIMTTSSLYFFWIIATLAYCGLIAANHFFLCVFWGWSPYGWEVFNSILTFGIVLLLVGYWFLCSAAIRVGESQLPILLCCMIAAFGIWAGFFWYKPETGGSLLVIGNGNKHPPIWYKITFAFIAMLPGLMLICKARKS